VSYYKDTGITFYEDDRNKGPFIIRVGGTREFVSNIETGYYSRFGSPKKKVTLVEGWDNPGICSYQTMDEAIKAAVQVWNIEGFHTTIEVKG
tara:strand:- start:248 stop:523 length:276 start_codon:yes stop_codon:yes gene_type:complete